MKILRHYLDTKAFDKALPLAEQWVRDAPSDASSYLYRAACYAAVGKERLMLVDLCVCLDLEEELLETVQTSPYFEGQCYNPFFRRIAFPDEPLNEGVELMYGGEYEEAVAFFQQNFPAPQETVKFFYLSICHCQLEEWEVALQASQQYQVVAPPFADAFFNDGYAYQEMNMTKLAILSYQKALEFDSTHCNAYYNLGKILIGENRLQEALYYFDGALTHDAGMRLAWFYRAEVKARLQDKAGATADAKQLLALDAAARTHLLENEFLAEIAQNL